MSVFSPALFSLTPGAFWRWGRVVLVSGLALGVAVLLLLTWTAPELLPFYAALLLGGAAIWYLFQRPLLNLCVMLAAFVVIADFEAGIQASEVLYGLYVLGFLAHWFITRRLLYGERLLHTVEEKALMLFLVLLAFTPLLTILFGGSVRGMMSEGFSLTMLALYFPVKEACVRYKHGPTALLVVIAWIGLFAALRNFMNYQEILVAATQEWQIAKGRVARNESLLVMPALASLALLIFAHQWRHRTVLLGLFLTYFAALVLTQSRGYWVSFLLGAFVLFLLVNRRYKGRLVLLGVAGLAGFLGLGALFFGAYLWPVLTSLVERFASLGTAASRDLSLVNRFYESKAVLVHIARNPVLGYGMGVSYYFYDLTWDYTRVDTFVHNGYLSLWFKFGLWGLGLVLFFWLRAAWRGVQVFRQQAAAPLLRLGGLVAAIALASFVFSANTSNPFYLNDTTFVFGVLMGLAGGTYRRAQHEAAL